MPAVREEVIGPPQPAAGLDRVKAETLFYVCRLIGRDRWLWDDAYLDAASADQVAAALRKRHRRPAFVVPVSLGESWDAAFRKAHDAYRDSRSLLPLEVPA